MNDPRHDDERKHPVTEIKIETDSDVCNALQEELGGYRASPEMIERKAGSMDLDGDVMLALAHSIEAGHVRVVHLDENNQWASYQPELAVKALRLAASPAPDPVRTALVDAVIADPTIVHLRECGFQSAAKFESTLRAAILRAAPQSVGNPLGLRETVAHVFREYIAVATDETKILLQELLHDIDDVLSLPESAGPQAIDPLHSTSEGK